MQKAPINTQTVNHLVLKIIINLRSLASLRVQTILLFNVFYIVHYKIIDVTSEISNYNTFAPGVPFKFHHETEPL